MHYSYGVNGGFASKGHREGDPYPWFMIILPKPVHISTFFFLDRTDCCIDRAIDDVFRVGMHVVKNATELVNNPACHEVVEYWAKVGSSGYYDCNLFGNVITVERPPFANPTSTPPMQIMEIKAWSQFHLNFKADPENVMSSAGPKN